MRLILVVMTLIFTTRFAVGENAPPEPIVNPGGINCAIAEPGKASPCATVPAVSEAAPPGAQSLDKEDFDRLSRDVYQKLREDVDRAESLSIERAERGQRRMEFIVSILGIMFVFGAGFITYIGFGKFSDLQKQMKLEVSSEISDAMKSVTSEVIAEIKPNIDAKLEELNGRIVERGSKIENVVKSLRFAELRALIDKINAGSSFTRTDRDTAMTGLEEFQDEVRSGAMGDSGKKAVIGLLDSLFKAGNWPQLRKLESLFPEMFQSEGEARNTMLQAYLNLVFLPAALPQDIDRARVYSQAAWAADYGETALPEDLVYIYHTEKDPDLRKQLAKTRLDMADSFDPREMLQFLNAFGSMLDVNLLAKSPDPQHHAISKVAMEVFLDHQARFAELVPEVDQDLAKRIGAPGLAKLIEELAKFDDGGDAPKLKARRKRDS